MGIDWFPLWLSLRVASLATLIALLGGLWVAWLLTRKGFRGRELVDAAVTLPLVLPPTVLGYYLLVLLGRMSPFGRLYESVFGEPLVFTWKARTSRHRAWRRVGPMAWAVVSAIALLSSSGCGGSSNSTNLRYSPSGNYQYKVTASSVSTGTVISPSVTLTLIVQ